MGLLDWFRKKPKEEEPVKEISVTEAPSSSGKMRDPTEIGVKRIGLIENGTSREYQEPEFDLATVQAAYDSEAYVRQAVDKYIELMFKAGWEFVGNDENIVLYLNQRFELMAEMTGIPTNQLWIEVAEDLVKFHNAILAKARDKDNVISGILGVQLTGLAGREPVSGYFPLNMTTMKVLRDKNGTVKSWQQEVSGGDKPLKLKADDVIHFYYKREKGKAFGTPFLLAALDDIRALRQAEENVLKLIYRNLFPYIHAKVGSQELPGTPDEVAYVQQQIESGDLEAGLVTTERVEITAVAADKVIDAEKYLRYFEQRVFTGLGVSELMMGRGNTANRSTGDNLSGEFTDRVKAYQRVIETFINDFIIRELLMEAGFDPLTTPEQAVEFRFNEIDFDALVKAENHAIFKYEHNSFTEDEMRHAIGKDPISDDSKLFMNRITIPTQTATAQAKAAAAGTSSGSNGTKATDNKNKPSNQHGTKPSPKKVADFVEEEFNEDLQVLEFQFMHLQQSLHSLSEQEIQNRITRLEILSTTFAKNIKQVEQIRRSAERISTEMPNNTDLREFKHRIGEWESEIYSILNPNEVKQ